MARFGVCVWPSPWQRDMDASSSSMFRIFDTAASGMLAQSVRLNTTASNMANADSVASSPDQVYRARQPVFAAIPSALAGDDSARGVRVLGIVQSQATVTVRYDPGNPLHNAGGTKIVRAAASDRLWQKVEASWG